MSIFRRLRTDQITIALRAYFYSGWVFLIPYLAAYLLYSLLKWPVNPGRAVIDTSWSMVPSLLTVYWFLHATHLLLVGVALRDWWHRSASPSASHRPLFSVLRPLLPWLLLALLFWIPGPYLEWPSDPWEHLRRTTEWINHQYFGTQLSGYKSFYFFAYTLVGRLAASTQLFWLNFYCTGVSLLLVWQNYLLAKSAGLDRHWSLLFVVVQILISGNSCFSFYRYYVLASTIFAQIGAVAMTRIALDLAQSRTRQAKMPTPSFRQTLRLPGSATRLVACGSLAALIAFNHLQGLGIAGLAVLSIGGWWLLRWKRSARWWLPGVIAALCVAATFWWPRQPAIDVLYRPQSWLGAWYGFNLAAWDSPAADRMMNVLGLLGLFNILAGIVLLLAGNQIVGWLTVGPVVGLSLPIIAIPLANSLSVASEHGHYIVVFNRMFFAVPAGLALVTLGQKISWWVRSANRPPRIRRVAEHPAAACIAMIVGLTAFLTLPANGQFLNRMWQLLARPPDDLMLRSAWDQLADLPRVDAIESPIIAATTANVFIMNVQAPSRKLLVKTWVVRHYENIGRSPADDFELVHLATQKPPYPAILTLPTTTFYTPYSQAAYCSGHWSLQVAVLSVSGTAEFSALAHRLELKPQTFLGGATLWSPP